MTYDISKATAPKMPTLGRGTECIKILLSQVSKDMYEPLGLPSGGGGEINENMDGV